MPDEEIRYDYGDNLAPWRQEAKTCSNVEKENKMKKVPDNMNGVTAHDDQASDVTSESSAALNVSISENPLASTSYPQSRQNNCEEVPDNLDGVTSRDDGASAAFNVPISDTPPASTSYPQSNCAVTCTYEEAPDTMDGVTTHDDGASDVTSVISAAFNVLTSENPPAMTSHPQSRQSNSAPTCTFEEIFDDIDTATLHDDQASDVTSESSAAFNVPISDNPPASTSYPKSSQSNCAVTCTYEEIFDDIDTATLHDDQASDVTSESSEAFNVSISDNPPASTSYPQGRQSNCALTCTYEEVPDNLDGVTSRDDGASAAFNVPISDTPPASTSYPQSNCAVTCTYEEIYDDIDTATLHDDQASDVTSESSAALKVPTSENRVATTSHPQNRQSNSAVTCTYEEVPDNLDGVTSRDDGASDVTSESSSPFNVPTSENPPATTSHTQGRQSNSSVQGSKSSPKGKRKPHRPCPFCLKMQAKLPRHMFTKHKDEQEIKFAMSLPKPARDREIDKLKKLGIYKQNKNIIKKGETSIIRERQQGDSEDLKMCCNCKGFFAKKYIYRHISNCKAQSDAAEGGVSCVAAKLINDEVDTDFRNAILTRFRNDEVGNFCRTDVFVTTIGRYQFKKLERKKDKKTEVRKSTMTDMRRLGNLFFAFQDIAKKDGKTVTSDDLINRKYFLYLEDALNSLSSKEDDGVKGGLKLAMGYLLKTSAKIMKGHYLINGLDDKAKSVDNFVSVLNLKWCTVFGDAEYSVNKERQIKLRRPTSLPLEEDVSLLRDYTVRRIQEVLENEFEFFSSKEFVELRDLTVCRLTMFNARRGGEPSRMLISEWLDAYQEVWIDQQRVQSVEDEMEKELLGKYKVAYQAGKWNKHLVPVLIPNDCVAALKKLSDMEVRNDCKVDADNKFLFPYTQKSNDHVSGWHATNVILKAANVSSNLTATKMRQRASTQYAMLELDEKQRCAFYRHMGHSEQMNQNVYQCPLAMQEIIQVGKFFDQLDHHDAESKVENGSRHKQSDKRPAQKESDAESTVENGSRHKQSDKRPAQKESDAVAASGRNVLRQTSMQANKQPEQQESVGRRYTRWAKADTAIVMKHFSDYIQDKGENEELPGKDEICQFLQAYPNVLKGMDPVQKRKTVYTKVVNERKTQRMRSKHRMQSLEMIDS